MLRANLNEIFVFMAVVDAGSFVAGGKAMGLTRSAAAKAVGRLEERLGVRLLNRTSRALSLTGEGRAFYDRAMAIQAAIDDAETSVRNPAGTPRGLLRLTVPDAFGRLVILPLLAKYLDAWPEVRAEVSFTDRVADLVEDGFDLAVRIGVTAQDTAFVSRVVATYGLVHCAAPSYLAKRGTPRNVDDLAGHDCLIFSSRKQRQSWLFRDEEGEWIKAQCRSRLQLDSGEAIRDAAIAGLGIARLPDFLVADAVASGRLHPVLNGVGVDDVKIVTLYPSRRLLEPRVRRFIDLLVKELGK